MANGRVTALEEWKGLKEIASAVDSRTIKFTLSIYAVAILLMLAVNYPKLYEFITNVT